MTTPGRRALIALASVGFATACGVETPPAPPGATAASVLRSEEARAVAAGYPEPFAACHDDLPGALSDACVACGGVECTESAESCGAECRSFLTCVTEQCQPGDDYLFCSLSTCRACSNRLNQASDYGNCLSERCPAECAALPIAAPTPPDPVPEPEDAGVTETGPICEDRLEEVFDLQCTLCAETACAPELSACGEGCRGLLSCVNDSCDADREDVACIASSCSGCLGSAIPAIAFADCMSASCSVVCPLFPSASPPPPPAPPPLCRDDVPSSVGDACWSCVQSECTSAVAACDGDCRSLVSCAADHCSNLPSDVRPSCAVEHCSPCLSGNVPASALVSCMQGPCDDDCGTIFPASADGSPAGGSETP